MKASELRIGNWINLRKRKVHIEYYRISTGHDIYLLDESDCYDATPIKLTHELILKCGYSVTSENSAGIQYNYYKKESIFKSCHTFTYFKKSDKYFKGELEIKSLHQLQNLYFALTNQELNIQL